MPKFIQSQTLEGGKYYDVLFQIDKTVKLVDRLFDYYTLEFEYHTMLPVVLPVEITLQILFKTLVKLLKEFHFADALRLVCTTKEMVHQVYYCIYGTCQVPTIEKVHRLSKTFHLVQNIFDHYFTSEGVYATPAIVLDYERNFMLAQTSAFYPWQFDTESPNVIIADVAFTPKQGFEKFLEFGEFYGDRALLDQFYECRGVVTCTKLAFPFVHFIFMDAFTFLNVFTHPDTTYHFARFATFMKAIFGPYCRLFFYEAKLPIQELLDEDQDFTHIFDNTYTFKEIPFFERQ